MNRWLSITPLILCVLLWGSLVATAQKQQLDADEIVKRSIELSQKDWQRTPDYDYFERQQDGSNSKTYEVRMMLGSRYRRLVAVNDKPLSQENQAREQRQQQNTLADRERETPQQREERVAQYRKEVNRQQPFLEQIPKAFRFTLEGKQVVGSREVFVLRAHPRPDYRPPNSRAKALTAMEGTLWVDAKDLRWVRVEAEVKRPVSIEGFFARVQPGTRFLLEQQPTSDGVWLPSRFSLRTRAKLMMLIPRNAQEDSSYYGYKRIGN
jgi:hypothetical protein